MKNWEVGQWMNEWMEIFMKDFVMKVCNVDQEIIKYMKGVLLEPGLPSARLKKKKRYTQGVW